LHHLNGRNKQRASNYKAVIYKQQGALKVRLNDAVVGRNKLGKHELFTLYCRKVMT
jgi:hypothetical protein